MTKKELISAIMDRTDDYTKSALEHMVKSELEFTLEQLNFEAQLDMPTEDIEEPAVQMTSEEHTEFNSIKEFDLARYAAFTPSQKMQYRARTQGQMKLVWALENNYKVRIDTNDAASAGFYGLSMKIRAVFDAIRAGKVQKRTDDEIIARIRASKAVRISPASKSQLDMITKLEKETGVVVTAIISSREIASKVITDLLHTKKNLDMQREAAASAPIEEKTYTKLDAVKSYFKRLFA